MQESQDNQETLDQAQIADAIANMMGGGGDSRMWRNLFADRLEAASVADDLSLLRAGKEADAAEASFLEFAAAFPGLQLVTPPEGGFYEFNLGLVKLDRDARIAVLRALATELRK